MGTHGISISILEYLKFFHNRKFKKKSNKREINFSSGKQKGQSKGLWLREGVSCAAVTGGRCRDHGRSPLCRAHVFLRCAPGRGLGPSGHVEKPLTGAVKKPQDILCWRRRGCVKGPHGGRAAQTQSAIPSQGMWEIRSKLICMEGKTKS